MRPILCNLAFAIAASGAAGCLDILGTSGYKPCESGSDDRCDDGSDGSGGSSSTSTSSSSSSSSSDDSSSSSSSSSTATGTDCFDLTVHVSGSVKVKLGTPDADFEPGFAGPICAPAGTTKLEAECDQGGGNDPPVAVSWGNAGCDDGTTACTFALQHAETFTVAAAACP